MMVGVNISDEQLGSIADRTIQEADQDGDSAISFTEFVKVSQSPFGLKKLNSTAQEGGRKTLFKEELGTVSPVVTFITVTGFLFPGFGEGGCRTENEHPISSLKD